ncbi:MAG: ROK family protein [Actinomycetota bacterium]|jgi:glucokinase|nr:ROK family protein [Actinomycetota bacterium]
MEHFLALDIGGTKFGGGVVSERGDVISYVAAPTPKGGSGSDLWELAKRVLHEAMDSSDVHSVSAVGIGSGGPMDLEKGLVSPLNIPGWRDFPLRSSLEEEFGVSVYLDNDGKALTLGEGLFGRAKGRRDFVAMVVSTGIGGGIILDGRLLNGRLGNTGHIGHVNVEENGNLCGCGAIGCLEAHASGIAIVKYYGMDPRQATEQVKIRCGEYVGRGVASVASLLDLDLIVVGGSVALGFGDVFFNAAQKELSARARLSFSSHAKIVPVGLGEHGPIIGAATVAISRERGLF